MRPLKLGEIYLVYQDCAMCGAREGWGKKQTEVANTHGFKIIEVGFLEHGASEIIKKVCLGVEEGGKLVKIPPVKPGTPATLPFFTDLKRFSKSLKDFVEATQEPETATPAPKSRRKTRKVNQDGDTQEND